MSAQVLHLANGITTACTSFHRANGQVGFSLMDYHSALANPTDHVRPCKTCHPHYVRRLRTVNKRRVAQGKSEIVVRQLPN